MTQKNKTIVIAEPGRQEFFIVREFEAPRELVFRAFGEPELLQQWLGSCDMTLHIEKLENKAGGSWRFINTDSRGNQYGFNGVIHEVTAPERMVRTFEFEGLPERGHVSLETATFEALDGGRTKLNIQSVFRSVADRDGMVGAGVERGAGESHSRLDELLSKIAH